MIMDISKNYFFSRKDAMLAKEIKNKERVKFFSLRSLRSALRERSRKTDRHCEKYFFAF